MSLCRARSRHCSPATRYEPWLLSAGAASKNGEPLRRAAEHFDILITADRNLEHQQNLRALPVSVVVLVASTNRLESLAPLVPELRELLKALPPRQLVRIGV